MYYHQITLWERYLMASLWAFGAWVAAIARECAGTAPPFGGICDGIGPSAGGTSPSAPTPAPSLGGVMPDRGTR